MATKAWRVNGEEYEIPTSFTTGEMCDAEQFFGVEFGADTSGFRMAAAMLWIAMRRKHPAITVDDIRSLPPEALTPIKGDASPPPPTVEEASSNGSSGDGSEEGSALLDSDQRISGVPV